MTGLGIRAAPLPFDEEHISRIGAYMGVYELALADGEVILIGFAGGRSVLGLRGELAGCANEYARPGVTFRYEITTSYISRYKELLMVHVAEHGDVPVGNMATRPELGRLSPI